MLGSREHPHHLIHATDGRFLKDGQVIESRLINDLAPRGWDKTRWMSYQGSSHGKIGGIQRSYLNHAPNWHLTKENYEYWAR